MKKGRIQPGKNTPVSKPKADKPKKTIPSAFMTKDEMIAKKAKMETSKTQGGGSNIQTKAKTKTTAKFGAPAGKPEPTKTSTAKAGSNIKTDAGKNYNVGVSKGGVSFGEAFKHFKNKGVKEFNWNGKRYNTKTKD